MTVGNMDSAELFDAGKKGRGLRARKDLKRRGRGLLRVQLLCCGLRQVCHSCFRQQADLHRCAQCKFAHYCDRTCQTACWNEHKHECGAIRKTGKAPSESVRLAARVLWRVHKDTGIVSDSQLISVDQLKDHVTDLPEEGLKQLQTDIKCNGFTLSDQRGLQAVGVGLFPNLCLVNHDCWPNCTVILNHGKIELRAVGKISEGEELTVSYVDFLNLSADRQKNLRESFHFECTCQHCSEKIIRSIWRRLILPVVTLCCDCLEKQENVLADTNLLKLRVFSITSEVLSFLRNFSEASDYARRMVEGY
ncbi:hypothetical protein F7725_015073, partial [Dissostichus mawsoni]